MSVAEAMPGRATKFTRRNYWAHNLEGGLFFAGMAFIQGELVLPSLVRSLGGSNLSIALAPILIMIGFQLPPLFTAHLVERLDRMKPFVSIFFGLHRLPFLAIGLYLIFYGDANPGVALGLTMGGLLLSGMLFGVCMTAWMELLDRTIGARRVSSSMAIRNIIGAGSGILAGGLIKAILDASPGSKGFGILFLVAFGFSVASYLIFLTIDEPSGASPGASLPSRATLISNLKGMPGLLARDHSMRSLFLCYIASAGLFVLVPFMGIHAVDTTGKGASFVGVLVMAQMMGAILGNVLAGWWGDLRGPKGPMMLARALFLGFCVGIVLAESVFQFKAMYFLFGIGFAMNNSARMAMMIEAAPLDKRPTFLAVATFGTLVFMGLSAVAAAGLRSWTTSIAPPAAVSGACIAVSLYFLVNVRDPRKAAA